MTNFYYGAADDDVPSNCCDLFYRVFQKWIIKFREKCFSEYHFSFRFTTLYVSLYLKTEKKY